MHLDWTIIWEYRDQINAGLQLTLKISLASILLSFILGVLVGFARFLPNFFLNRAAGLCIEVIRNIPVVVKLFVAYYVLGFDAFTAGILSLTLHQSAYIADVVAAGLSSLPEGQLEAAQSTGLTYRQAFTRILLPQALQITIPPLTTQFIQVIKNSSVVMLIALEDLTFATQQIEQETFRGVEASIAVTVIYLIIALAIAASMQWCKRSMDRRFG